MVNLLIFLLTILAVLVYFKTKQVKYSYNALENSINFLKIEENTNVQLFEIEQKNEKSVNDNPTLKTKRRPKKIGRILCKSYVYLFLFLMYAPIILLIIFSFTSATLVGDWDGFSFDLYVNLFKNKEIMTAVKNTFFVAICSAFVSTVLGTLGAIGIFYSKKKVRKLYEIGGQIPILNPEIVTALSITILFVFIGAKFNFITLLIGHVVLTIPFVILSIIPKLKQMDKFSYEAALDLGAKPATALRKVVFPAILPGIFSGFILAITLSLDDYIITAFTRDSSFNTLSTYVYGITSKKGALPPMLRALTTIIFVVTLIVLICLNLYNKKKKEVKK